MEGSSPFPAEDADDEGIPIPELLIERDRIFDGPDLLAVDAPDHIPIFKADGLKEAPFLNLTQLETLGSPFLEIKLGSGLRQEAR